MIESKIETYKLILEKVHQYQSGQIDWGKLIDLLYDASDKYESDELISEIFDLIEHEPKKGGLLGVNEAEWADYQSRFKNVMDNIKKEMKLNK